MDENRIVQKAEELKLLGSKIADVVQIINLQQSIIDWISGANYQDSDPKYHNTKIHQSLGYIFDSNQSILNELDEIAWQLMECTNEKELAHRKYQVVSSDE